MDGLPEKMAALALSIDEAKKQLKEWLDTTENGSEFKTSFESDSGRLQRRVSSLKEGAIAARIGGFLSWTSWSGSDRKATGLPSNLADHIFGPLNSEKILCDLPRLKDLMIKGDPLEFALGCYIDGKRRSRFPSDMASSLRRSRPWCR